MRFALFAVLIVSAASVALTASKENPVHRDLKGHYEVVKAKYDGIEFDISNLESGTKLNKRHHDVTFSSKHSHATSISRQEKLGVPEGTYAKCFDNNNCSVVHYVFEQTGWFATPNFPNNYPSNSNVCWYFPYRGILSYPSQFFWKEFCLDRNSDFIIYSETQFGPPSVSYSNCGNTGYYFWVPPYRDLYFRFKSGKYSKGFQGFNVTFGLQDFGKSKEMLSKDQQLSKLNNHKYEEPRPNVEEKTPARCYDEHDCQNVQYLFDANGSFASPHYPEHYPKNTNFCWYFPYNNMTNRGYRFSFEDICLDRETTLSINSDRYGGTFKSYSGCSIKKGFFETPPYWDLYFRLKTSKLVPKKGFNVTFKAK